MLWSQNITLPKVSLECDCFQCFPGLKRILNANFKLELINTIFSSPADICFLFLYGFLF